jgi:multiple sugar transport system substrate-binding protein
MTPPMDRRSFVTLAAAGAVTGLTTILGARRAPAYAQGTTIHLLRWNDFVPGGDEVLKGQMADAGRAFGARFNLERINANDIQARVTAAVSSGAGPDVIHMLHNWAHLYERSLVDVSDVAQAIASAQGGYYQAAEDLCKVGGAWRALPHAITPNLVVYRRSQHEAIGVREFPKTWTAWRETGKKLKATGFPVGQTVAHTFGDSPAFWYPYLWSWGGKEVERDGRTVAVNSKETVESVKFAVGFWKDACDEGGLAWDDTNNNRAFLSGTISATQNAASIYLVALGDPAKFKTEQGAPLHTDMGHAPLPGGPAGTYSYHGPFHHAVMGYSKNQKLAKDFLLWLHSKEAYEPWFVAERGYAVATTRMWEGHALWRQDPVMAAFRDAARSYRLFGYAGPPSARATEAFSKYVIVDMYAKAIQGMPAEDAVRWAEGELRKIYT